MFDSSRSWIETGGWEGVENMLVWYSCVYKAVVELCRHT